MAQSFRSLQLSTENSAGRITPLLGRGRPVFGTYIVMELALPRQSQQRFCAPAGAPVH